MLYTWRVGLETQCATFSDIPLHTNIHIFVRYIPSSNEIIILFHVSNISMNVLNYVGNDWHGIVEMLIISTVHKYIFCRHNPIPMLELEGMDQLCWHVTCNTVLFKTNFLHISECISSQESSNRLRFISYFLLPDLQVFEFDSSCEPNESKWLRMSRSCVEWVWPVSNWVWLTNV